MQEFEGGHRYLKVRCESLYGFKILRYAQVEDTGDGVVRNPHLGLIGSQLC